MTSSNPYRAAGTFSGEAYTERDADRRLIRAIEQNAHFPYMLAPRQSGKSSLIKHTMDRLPAAEFRSILIDLSILSPEALKNYDTFLDEFFAACLKGLGVRRPGPTSGTFLDRVAEALGAARKRWFFSSTRSMSSCMPHSKTASSARSAMRSISASIGNSGLTGCSSSWPALPSPPS